MKRLPFKNRMLFLILRTSSALTLALAASLMFSGIQNTMAAGEFTATKVYSLFTDINGNTKVNMGDTLQYTVVITNTSGVTQLSTQFTDTIDSNTTLVPGSLRTTPIARNDSGFSTVGNVQLTVTAASSVLNNDNDPDGTGAVTVSGCGADTTAPFDCLSTNNGNVSLSADGGFTFNPFPGFSGTDTFTYTISDTSGATDTATVSITVGTPVWFINIASSPGGDGRFTGPFNSITNFNSSAADDIGDYIFIYTGSYGTTGITLLNNQQLIGNGVSLSLSPNLSITSSTSPTIGNITLANGNTVRGLNVSTNTGTGISGANVGALTINTVSVTNTSGIGISLSGGNSSMAVTFNSVSSSGGANGIVLTNNSGSFTSNGGTIDPTTGHGISVSNTEVGPLNFTLSNSTITAAPVGFNGINFDIATSGSFGNISIQNNTISNNGDTGINANIQGTGSITKIDIGSNTFSNNLFGVNLATNGTASIDFDIHNNSTMNGTNSQVAIVANDTIPNNGSGPTMEGYVRSNIITVNPAAAASSGIEVISTGDGNIITDINNNSVSNFSDVGIAVESIAGTGDVNARIANNNTSTTAGLPFAGLYLRSGNGTGGETNLLCVNLSGNNINGGAGALADYYLRRPNPATSNTFQIQGISASPATAAQAQTYVISTDSVPPATAFASTGSYVNATCSTVSFAALPTQPELAAELDQTRASAADQTPAWNDALTSLENSASNWVSGLIHNMGVSTAHASGETVNLSLGTFDPGQAVTITFRVNVDNSTSATQVSNQGSVSSSLASATLTDDPGVGGASDATVALIEDLTPPDTSILSNPANPSNSSSATFTFSGSDNVTPSGSLTFECSMDSGAFSACTTPFNALALVDGSHTFQVRAKDAGNNVDATPASYTWTVDTTSPPAPVVITPANGSSTVNTTPTITGTGEPNATITIFIDGLSNATGTADGSGNWSIAVASALSNGSHTVRARATDAAGNTSPDSNTNTFTVDDTAPDTTITGNPSDPSATTTPSFTFTGNDGTGIGGITFECKLDTAAFTVCTSPFITPALIDGSHTFQVRAKDSLGNTDATPASYTWIVDSAAPDTTILSTPSNPSTNTTPSFTFSSEPGATFECKLDSGAFTACTSPFTTPVLSNGSHTFQVRATDSLGNTDTTPASYTWTVDTVSPNVTINKASADPTSAITINFTAVFNEPVTGFGDNAADVSLSGSAGATTATVSETAPNDGTTYNIAVSGMTASGDVIVSIPASAATDLAGNPNNPSSSIDDTVAYVVDNASPTVKVEQATGQADPTGASPILFTVTFNEAIDTATFIPSDITLNSTAGAVSASITEIAPNDGTTFEIQVSGMTIAGTVTASITAAKVKDLAGNDNLASTSVDNTVTFDSNAPSVSGTTLQAAFNGTGPSSFMVYFSEEVYNPAGNSDTDDVTNPANFLIIEKGTNGVADTLSCAGGVLTDDVKITVSSVDYFTPPPSAKVNLAAPLPVGSYRLFICGTTSIVDLALTPLGGFPGTDFTFDFVVSSTGNTSTDTEDEEKVSASSLPTTGFAPNKITALPAQPATLEYANLGDLWLEIPSLKVKSSIVGVPQNKDNSWDVTWLGNNTGWLNGTAFPTWNGNSVLTAHVTNASGLEGPFAALRQLKYGDQVIVHMGGVKYVYEVRNTKLVSPYSTSFAFESLKEHSYLTLITCQGYNPLTDTYFFRRVARAVLVSTENE